MKRALWKEHVFYFRKNFLKGGNGRKGFSKWGGYDIINKSEGSTPSGVPFAFTPEMRKEHG